MMIKLFLPFIIASIFIPVSATENLASILKSPSSHNVTVNQAGGQVNIKCEAKADILLFHINNNSAELNTVQKKGFVPNNLMVIDGVKILRVLTIYLSKEMVGRTYEIFCIGLNFSGFVPIYSNLALFQVAGPLDEPKDLSLESNADSFSISWTPPPTLDNTDILGYNVTVNNEPYTFTHSPEVHIYYSDFSPCDTLNITISGYNGVDGNITTLPTLYVPKKPMNNIFLPVKVPEVTTDNENIKFHFTVDVSNLVCIGQRPSHANVTLSPLDEDTIDLYKFEQKLITSSSNDKIMVLEKLIEVKIDKEYKVAIRFYNPLGAFDNVDFYLCCEYPCITRDILKSKISYKKQNNYKGSTVPCNYNMPAQTASLGTTQSETTTPTASISTQNLNRGTLVTNSIQACIIIMLCVVFSFLYHIF